MATSTMGAIDEPMRLLPRFCMTPALSPRRFSSDSSAMSDCEIGSTPPSAVPMSMRDSSSTTNDEARPDSAEHSENTTTVISRIDLRLPVLSDRYPMPSADSAKRERQRRGEPTYLRIGEVQVLLHEGPEVAHRVPVEEHEAEGQAEHGHEPRFVTPFFFFSRRKARLWPPSFRQGLPPIV